MESIDEIITKSTNQKLTQHLMDIIIENSSDEFFDLSDKIKILLSEHTKKDLNEILYSYKLKEIKTSIINKIETHPKKLTDLIDNITFYKKETEQCDYHVILTWKMTIGGVKLKLEYNGDNEGEGEWGWFCDEYSNYNADNSTILKYIRKKLKIKNVSDNKLLIFILDILYDSDVGDIYDYF